MKIAQISPLIESVPPKFYGGTERIVSYLTEELVRQGHDVTLFASGDSETTAKLVPVVPTALRLGNIDTHLFPHLLLLDQVRKRAHEFDILHFHIDALPLPVFHDIAYKTLTTLHGRLDLPWLNDLYGRFPDMPLVSISESQWIFDAPAWKFGTVYHGIPAKLYTPPRNPGNYLAFLGRISREKGPDCAIEIAEMAGMPLKIAAKIDRSDQQYFDEEIKHLFESPFVEYIGEINDANKCDFLGNASALLFPINWPEPFGLTMIESMACGTPVIAFNRGSVPEVIDDGLTGFIVSNVEEAVEALRKVDQLDRKLIRKRFEERFSVKRMARDYVELYHKLLFQSPRLELGLRRLDLQ